MTNNSNALGLSDGINVAHSYLVQPGKGLLVQPTIIGTEIPMQGLLFEMVNAIFEKPEDCNIEIAFAPNESLQQQNDCMDLILAYVNAPNEPNGKKLAERLQSVTTNRSGLGLLFLMLGAKGREIRFMLARFPAHSGVLAEQSASSLTVEFIEKVFLKNANAYKSVVYSGVTPASDFWEGRAIDKQINTQTASLSDYWIKDFLLSDFRTTPAAGTKRLANALKSVAKKAENLEVKEQIIAAAKLGSNLQGTRTSIAGFVNRLNLADEVKEAVRKELDSEKLYNETFQFDSAEFARHIAYRSVELNTGAVLSAPAAEFEDIFQSERLTESEMLFKTQGHVVAEKIRKAK